LKHHKEAIYISTIGYLNVHAFASKAQIPIKDTAIKITDNDEDVIAFRLTNRSGKLYDNIQIQVPALTESQSPITQMTPYATVNIYARKENYEEIIVRNVQIFADTVTLQNLELIPLPEFPETGSQTEEFFTQSQNL